jgi:hypothetical protein
MASGWARQRFNWLDQVLADRETTPAAFVVAYAISTFSDKDTGVAFPAQATLKTRTGLTERHIRTSTELLASRGHLEMSKPPTRGRGHFITYRPVIRNGKATAPEQTALFADAEMGRPPQPQDAAPENADFEAFWQQYPRRVAKGAARRAYERVIMAARPSTTSSLPARCDTAPNELGRMRSTPSMPRRG